MQHRAATVGRAAYDASALRRDAKVDLLKKVPLFAGCSKTELRQLARIADEIDLREGTVLTREGRAGREFFVLIAGDARVSKQARRSRTSVQATGSGRSPC